MKFKKAKGLAEGGKVQFKGLVGSSLYFTVFSNSDHEVIFRITNNRWMCDCEYYTRKNLDCSHVLACKYWLQQRENDIGEKIKTDKTE